MDKDKIDKKDHILDVAERVFSEMGFDGASTRMISGEAGVNMAMLNYYFGSKEGLFLAVIERKITYFQNILQILGNDESISSWGKIESYIEIYGDRVVNNNCFQKLLYQELTMNRRTELAEKIRNILMKSVSELFRIMQEGIDNGEFRKDTDMQMVVATLYGTKNFIMNTPLMSSTMLGIDIQDEKVLEEQFKPRIKTYLKNLLKAYLVNETIMS
ncbi:transcriptional regulator, TetR family [Mucilaginibacter lappiensis]|uniref:TetR/AcrR family transcriptional regulator n=1 Tax=Mucilaginibacter lappiensis TaxID=354630 RepID=A0ABR6PT56_9SPHI|nr:TetR/AcrR family transcriptional regulator [Mucilaginibacter lappiensis]MBB6112806.1 TetR/AcrR family transcriptional regulator [Mucilaginibacter lappiensis]SIS06886.1 transcriptional regulator, TetR family [Mucilaginibacter lappiensis]